MVNKYRKRCSTPLIIREIQIKVTIKDHLTPVRMAITKKKKTPRNNKCWQECGEKGALMCCWCVCVLVAQSCPTLCNPTDCSPPGSSVHGILQARILEWIAICFFRGSSQPRDRTWVSCIISSFCTV